MILMKKILFYKWIKFSERDRNKFSFFGMMRSNKFRANFALDNQRISKVSNAKKSLAAKKNNFFSIPKHKAVFSVSLRNDSFFWKNKGVASIFRFRNFYKNASNKNGVNDSSQ